MITKVKNIYKRCKIIVRFYNRPSKKAILLAIDLFRWTWQNRGEIVNFFVLGLYQKGVNISDYLTFRTFEPYYHKFYPIRYICLLEDKLVFEKFINNYPAYAPKNIGFVTKKQLYLYESDPQPVGNILNYPMDCMIKNVDGFGGKNVFKLTVKNGEIAVNNSNASWDDFISKLPRKAVVQQVLEQHETLKKLHPASLNTMRINTVNPGDEVIVLSSLLRIGLGKSVVDNISSGGMYVPVNINNGKLNHFAFSDYEPMFYYAHPETNIRFEDMEIPFFNQAKELCQKLHAQLPYFFLIGWDVAFTPTGPVIIEANNLHQVIHAQISEGGLKRRFDDYVEKFMSNRDQTL
jgi:hypothetical protein